MKSAIRELEKLHNQFKSLTKESKFFIVHSEDELRLIIEQHKYKLDHDLIDLLVFKLYEQ